MATQISIMNNNLILKVISPNYFLRNAGLFLLMAILFIAVLYVLFNTKAKELGVAREVFYEKSDGTSGIRAVLISDLHINCLPVDIGRIIGEIQRESPEFIIFAGDFAHDKKQRDNSVNFIRMLYQRVGCPVYIVYGNHDYKELFENNVKIGEDFTRRLTAISPDICVLDDNYKIFRRKDGTGLLIGGLTDISVRKTSAAAVMNTFKKTADKEGLRFLAFSHNPDILLEIDPGSCDVFLAGHTHAGQVKLPFHWEFKLLRRHDKLACKGIFYGRHLYNDIPLYITSGLGCSLLPIRWNTKAEIVSLEIFPDR